ncbi:hypothetical protein [Methylobacterium goesingense]|uniref:Uncharacterized protein n=1 Tax=Methylobacterium goesingense TaxID=243690 RepID=A0ABV2L8Z8_9HYPH|nr:hypothetical protein [Methylobacterium goesingense]
MEDIGRRHAVDLIVASLDLTEIQPIAQPGRADRVYKSFKMKTFLSISGLKSHASRKKAENEIQTVMTSVSFCIQ